MPRAVQSPPGVMRKSEYATHRKCSPAYVSKLIRQGKLAPPALLDDGRINVALADQLFDTAAPDLPLPAAPSPAATARADREHAQARLARIRADQAEGKLLTRSAVEARTFELIRRLRDELLAWPAAIAPRLTTQTNERAIADLLTAELEEKLGRLADALEEQAADDAQEGAEA